MTQEKNSMNCAQFEEVVHDLERPGTEGFAARDSALEHAEECSRCGELLTRVEALESSLHMLQTQAESWRATQQGEEALMEAFRQEKRRTSQRAMGWQVAALGAAAALLLVLGLSLKYKADHFHVNPSLKSPSAAPQAATPHPGVQEPVETVAITSQDSNNFVPLPYADDPDAVDGGAIVRVELSRSALASLGMPVATTDDANDTNTISADLLVSEDGTPQAIRLVSQSDAN
jgi:hypothetical protein